MSIVKVKRKGQVTITIPISLRRRLDIQEGSLLQVEEHEKGILLRPVKPLRAGDVAGEGKYWEVLRDLETLRGEARLERFQKKIKARLKDWKEEEHKADS